jgi:hypothetical protein
LRTFITHPRWASVNAIGCERVLRAEGGLRTPCGGVRWSARRAGALVGIACSIIDDTSVPYVRESAASAMRSALAANSESQTEARVATDGWK